MAKAWTPFPYDDEAYRYTEAALKKHWERLHRGDHEPWPGHEDNGKCSSSAILFDLLNDGEATLFFARMATAGYNERERGHTGNFFNILWALPGVSTSMASAS